MLGITAITMLWFMFGIIVGIVLMITVLVVKKDFIINMALSKMQDEVEKKMENVYENGEKEDE